MFQNVLEDIPNIILIKKSLKYCKSVFISMKKMFGTKKGR
jgi:hypothetical protein